MTINKAHFSYITGLKRNIFRSARLSGSWDREGRYSSKWTTLPMNSAVGNDGCPCFGATVNFDASHAGSRIYWGVELDGPSGNNIWGIPSEVDDHTAQDRFRTFLLRPTGATPQEERYYLTHCRRLGANKSYRAGKLAPGLIFAVWAPNAENVEIVFGGRSGYIADDGFGIDPSMPTMPMFRQADGIWQTDELISPMLADFSRFDHKLYMYRITKKGGTIAYRTDLYSRCQIGSGKLDPSGSHFTGTHTELDGTKSCSVVINPDAVARNFKETVWPEDEFVPEEEFWGNEFSLNFPLQSRTEDLIIYELHVGALVMEKTGRETSNMQSSFLTT